MEALRCRIRRLLSTDEYNIGIVSSPIASFLESKSLPEVRWLPKPPSVRYQADPFGVYRDGRLYLFFEEMTHCCQTGRIAVAEVLPDGSMTPSRPVLQLPMHLSYPYLFEVEGVFYCIPETLQTRTVSLYRIENFPYDWSFVTTLIDGIEAVDSSVVYYQNRWWLFTASRGKQISSDTPISAFLSIWYADSLTGPWRPHQNNPVKNDIHSARPAGTPFIHDGTLYRPAQDCSPIYGGKTVIHRVLELTPERYREEPVNVIEPINDGPYPDGLHTISTAGDITFIDGYRVMSPLSAYGICMKFWRIACRKIRGITPRTTCT